MFKNNGYRRALALVVMLAGGVSGSAQAGVSIFTGIPGASSTAANPFTIQIDNGAGVLTTVNVPNIVGGGGPGADTAATKAAKIRAAVNAQAPVYGATGILNQVTIGSTARVRITADPTKEAFDKLGNGVQYLALFGGSGNSTGLDPYGAASVVSMGIEGSYVASFMPTTGLSPSAILTALASDLTSHGIGATFDSGLGQVQIDRTLAPSEVFVFGNTDMGFNSFAESNGVAPAPGSLALLAAGGLVSARRRRRG